MNQTVRKFFSKINCTEKEITENLRKQELQAQGYHRLNFAKFFNIDEAQIIHREIMKINLLKFNHYDNPDMIITTLGSGIYIFFQDRKIQYIGSSKEMRARIRKHARMQDRKRYYPNDRIITIGTMTWKDAKRLENLLIIPIQPPRNRKKTLQGKGKY